MDHLCSKVHLKSRQKRGIVSNANRGISISSVFVKITPLGENPKSLVFLVVRLYLTVVPKKKKGSKNKGQ